MLAVTLGRRKRGTGKIRAGENACATLRCKLDASLVVSVEQAFSPARSGGISLPHQELTPKKEIRRVRTPPDGEEKADYISCLLGRLHEAAHERAALVGAAP